MNLSIKNVPESLVSQLRVQARRNHRSLQGELLDILERTLHPCPLNLQEALRQLRVLGFDTGDDAQQMIREDRDGR